jgi:hypothetical protein
MDEPAHAFAYNKLINDLLVFNLQLLSAYVPPSFFSKQNEEAHPPEKAKAAGQGS